MKRVALFASIVLMLPSALQAQDLGGPVTLAQVSNWFYVDHGGNTDWNCGHSTYGGHGGTDFTLAGGWPAMDAGSPVHSGSTGMVWMSVDGNFDRCTSCPTSQCTPASANRVEHFQGGLKIGYWHLRRGSVMQRTGAMIVCGSPVGYEGSSGCATGPHLHFDVATPSDVARDPFHGPCSAPPSLFRDQGPYRGVPGPCTPPRPDWRFELVSIEGPGTMYSGDRAPVRVSLRNLGARAWDASTRLVATDEMEDPTWIAPMIATSVDLPTPPDAIGTFTFLVLAPVVEVPTDITTMLGVDQMGVGAIAPGGLAVTVHVLRRDASIVDADADGYVASVDCNDHDASVHPDAVDVCGDSIDRDCSGSDACGATTDAGVGDAATRSSPSSASSSCSVGGASSPIALGAFAAAFALLLARRRR